MRQQMACICLPCQKPFSCLKALYRHQRETKAHPNVVSPVKANYICPDCNKTFTRAYDLRRHGRERNANGKRLAPSCGRRSRPKSKSAKATTATDRVVLAKTDSDRQPTSNPYREISLLAIRRRTLEDSKPWVCGICRDSFTTDSPAMIFDHLKHHFSMSMESYSCEECKIGFIHGADLRRHQRSADDGDCSFRFHHIDDCTGHHPPGRDHLNMWDKLRHWEQCQLQSYVLSVEMLRSRRLGALYTRSDSSAACRACQILRFFNDQFSEQFEGTYLTHLKAHRDSTVDQTSLSHDIAASQIDEMIRTLSGRYRRATSAATTTAGTKTYPEMENKTSYDDAKI